MPRMLTFGEAINRCKKGAKIARLGWNGKGQYVELATRISYVNAQGETVNVDHEAIGNNALAFVGTSGVQIGWLASQADMLAVDWMDVSESAFKDTESSDFRSVEDIINNIDCELMTLRVVVLKEKLKHQGCFSKEGWNGTH